MMTIFDPLTRTLSIETVSSASGSLTFLGGDSPGGSYVLRIRVDEPLRMPFGRFKGGKLVDVAPGEHSYVGSALAERGATCLARRLVRHASRTGDRPPHPIRRLMEGEFPRLGLGRGDLRPKGGKHLKWNVDHLLDRPCVTLTGAYVIRWPRRVECGLGRLLADDPATVAFKPRLGANDLPGCTHLLRVEAGEAWWSGLPGRLQEFLLAAGPEAGLLRR